MFAIVKIGGHQYKVEENQQLFVNRLEGSEGDLISFDEVLLTSSNAETSIGTPVLEATSVGVKVLEHLKADKEIVFKKKRRKGYRVKNGHRQPLTKIQVVGIGNKSDIKEKSEKVSTEIKSDDLTKIEGIGPKAAEVLSGFGINTFVSLSETSVEKIEEILNSAENLSHLNPTTWAEQSGLAAAQKWEELEELQQSIVGGVISNEEE